MNLRLKLSRQQDDQQGAQVAIVNESFARRFLPNENPVGKSIRMLPPLELLPKDALAQVGSQVAPMRTIVGMIADMKDSTLNAPAEATVFAPFAQYKNEGFDPEMVFVVKTTGGPGRWLQRCATWCIR